MKSIYQMELEDKFNRKIKYREKKLKNQRMIIGKQQEEIERLNKRWKVLRTYLNEMWLDDKGSVRRLQEFVKLLENGSDKE